jgi:hypothetical protein
MRPETGNILKQDFEIRQIPSKTYRLVTAGASGWTEGADAAGISANTEGLEVKGVSGMTDGLEAVKQSVFCILHTERFDWLIYSWNYGVELNELFGKSPGVVKSKLKKRIREALTQDDRIVSVDAFSFSVSGSRLHVSFCVHTKFGVMEAGTEVEI